MTIFLEYGIIKPLIITTPTKKWDRYTSCNVSYDDLIELHKQSEAKCNFHLNQRSHELYEGYHIWEMLIWGWVVWSIVIFWIFAISYNIPDQRVSKERPIDILNRRLANGEIDKKNVDIELSSFLGIRKSTLPYLFSFETIRKKWTLHH
jgi:putative membrane protein